jgi:hypothetical protein
MADVNAHRNNHPFAADSGNFLTKCVTVSLYRSTLLPLSYSVNILVSFAVAQFYVVNYRILTFAATAKGLSHFSVLANSLTFAA